MSHRKGGRMAGKLLSDEFQKNICLDFSCKTIQEAITKAGRLLLQNQYIQKEYIDGMLRREQEHSTYIGCGVMIPHGTEDSLSYVLRPGISIVKLSNGIDCRGETVTLVIGISSREEDPLQELLQITDLLIHPLKSRQFLNASSKQDFIDIINENYMEEGEL